MDSLLLFLATFHNGFSDFGTICKYLTVAHRSEMLEVISRRIFYMQNIHISIRKNGKDSAMMFLLYLVWYLIKNKKPQISADNLGCGVWI